MSSSQRISENAANVIAQRLNADRQSGAAQVPLRELISNEQAFTSGVHPNTMGAEPKANDLTIADAYVIQNRLVDILCQQGAGDQCVGYKIALTSPAMQEMCGVDHPLAGVLFSTLIHQAPHTASLAKFMHLGIEFELAVQLAEDLIHKDTEYVRDDITRVAGAVMPAFEFIDDRKADYSKFDAVSIIAENCWNAGVVLGVPMPDWRKLDLSSAQTSLEIDGEAVDKATTGDALGHPFDVVTWIANLLRSQGKQLKKDMIIMTGSSMRTQFPVAGNELTFRIAGIGEISIQLVP